MPKVDLLVGTRPNFVKVTQFKKELENFPNLDLSLIHSNQHYTDSVSAIFFEQFNLKIDKFLTPFIGNPSSQIGHIIYELSEILSQDRPDLLLVVGDVNTTLAGAIVANKLGIKLGHIESGLRSFDRSMPEEINRILVDEVCDMYFVTEPSGHENLLKEGKDESKIHWVGNTMIDTLVAFEEHIEQTTLPFETGNREIITVTLHRPSNVDELEGIEKIIRLLTELSLKYQVVFPIHPRTENRFKNLGLHSSLLSIEHLTLTTPLDYFSFQKLARISKALVTDSGGIQEETTFLKIPCITLRENTERPITTTIGSNVLMDFDVERILSALKNPKKNVSIPELWDGKSTQRILQVIDNFFTK
ncbi:MAG: non-hydrolyzing UDP-N-acetylglucosamine 2-epimerase [Crocinitomicaceae bacterium]